MDNRILIQATVSNCGRHVSVAPGVEIPRASVREVADMPPPIEGLEYGLVLLFQTDADRAEFAAEFEDDLDAAAIDLR